MRTSLWTSHWSRGPHVRGDDVELFGLALEDGMFVADVAAVVGGNAQDRLQLARGAMVLRQAAERVLLCRDWSGATPEGFVRRLEDYLR